MTLIKGEIPAIIMPLEPSLASLSSPSVTIGKEWILTRKSWGRKEQAGLMYSYREGHISPGNTVSLYTVHCRAGVAITIIDILLL